jgi:hypothetical protein
MCNLVLPGSGERQGEDEGEGQEGEQEAQGRHGPHQCCSVRSNAILLRFRSCMRQSSLFDYVAVSASSHALLAHAGAD